MKMANRFKADRRNFLKQAAGALVVASPAGNWSPAAAQTVQGDHGQKPVQQAVGYPRQFEGRQLGMISFPLGGVAAGSIGLGGRGQLRDWEIFNRPNKGYRPSYAFPSIWVQASAGEPMARVLEARILPPYEGQDGLGSSNVSGLSRLESATFIGEYPLAHIVFRDQTLPVKVELDAFSPFIPHDADESGLPVAVLRYRVTNPGLQAAKVGIAFSVDNPVVPRVGAGGAARPAEDTRSNTFLQSEELAGLLMTNPGLHADDPMAGGFVLAAMTGAGGRLSHWTGWPKGRWWNSPLLFWDQFSTNGDLGEQPKEQNAVGALCLQRTVLPGESGSFVFVLGWHFPNRTPDWCGWEAPPGEGKTVIGNYYAARFKDAWDAAAYAARNLERLEARTLQFVVALRESSLPAEVKEAASANLSTLASTTCFRTADGEFHAFEGSDDTEGCCFGNCTHVWNYETATTFLFPSFARSLRESAFGYSMDDAGAMHFRQLLPDGKARSEAAAADGQMGQIIHAWLDWKLSGDDAWLRGLWPRVKKALEFAWVPGGWDANRDGVLEGVQHNTYDVEFYGPNPLCGIYYLGALRAGEEMARAAGDSPAADAYRRLFEQGRGWIDGHLFNGEYYVQQVRGFKPEEIAPGLRAGMGADDTQRPEYQVGSGCLADQLIGQYLVEVGGMGPLVDPENIRRTLRSIYKYNYRPSLTAHQNVARTYVLNQEAAVLVCNYGTAARPRIPFPYFSEAWTGQEYLVAALMMNWGMVEEGLECVRNIRARFDGEKRNPWDEPECGHHYARAMSSWSTLVALSGFLYDGSQASVTAVPRVAHDDFRCFWATATGWGVFACRRNAAGSRFDLHVQAGMLRCRSVEITADGAAAVVHSGSAQLPHRLEKRGHRAVIHLDEELTLRAGTGLSIDARA